MLDLNYDDKFDVLYIGFRDRSNSVGDESDEGDVTFRDRLTGAVTGVTIFDFSDKNRQGMLPSLPYGIDYEHDIIPSL